MPDSKTPLPWDLPDPSTVKPLAAAGILIDLRRCVGCHACAVSCKTEHAVPLGTFRNRTQVVQRPDNLALSFIPMLCMHCQDAPCMTACPTDAISKGPDGRVLVDENVCDGNQECVRACPYDAIFLHPETQKASKCNLCEHRTAVGMPPACVEVCPTEALRYGDFGNASDPVAIIAAKEGARAMKPDANTKPQMQYVGLEDWMDEALPGVQRAADGAGEAGLTYE
ncbi:MAG: tetrathionate reductase subunit B [Myxococcota bacterium]